MKLLDEVSEMHAPDVRSERGVALVLAIAALVVIGALVAGTFFISSIEQKTAGNTTQSTQAFQAADAGVQTTIGNWNAASYNAIAANDSMKLGSTSLGGGSSYQVTIFPLNSKLFLLKSVGTNSGVTQTVASVVQITTATANVNASVTVTAPVTFNGNSFLLSGTNVNPQHDACSATPTPPSVIALRSSTTTGMDPSKDADNVVGLGGTGSAIGNDTSVTSLVNSVFGTGGTYDALKSAASKTFAPATYTGAGPTTIGTPATCNAASPMNWGEPQAGGSAVSVCAGYYPIVYATSTFGNPFKVSGGRGQGVMIVDGDLELTGGFEWTGLILVKGSFKITGTGAKVTGAVLAQNGASVDDNTLSGNTTISFSSCAISNALKGTATVVPVGQRAWTQIY